MAKRTPKNLSFHFPVIYTMKFSTLLFLFLPFWLTAQQPDADAPLVVASASIFADMARQIGGDAVRVETIVPVGGDPHLHEPTPRDAQLASSADLVLRNGLTFEGWLNELIENSGSEATVVTITQGITPIESQQYANATDPHAWMDGSNGLIYLKNIKDALTELVPDQREMFEFNYGVYRQQLEDLDTYMRLSIERIPEEKRVLITSHDAFQYYGRRYGLQLESVIGVSTDAEAQTSDILRLTEVIRKNKVPAIFVESTINPKMLEQIARDEGVRIGGQLYADSLGDEDSPAPTYLDMLRHNTETIVAALTDTTTPDTAAEAEDGTVINYILWGILGLVLVGGFVFVAKNVQS